MTESLLSKQDSTINHNTKDQGNSSRGHFLNFRDGAQDNGEGGRQMFSSKLAKLEFSKFFGDDQTEWVLRELWASFGPTKCENFDKALLRVKKQAFCEITKKNLRNLGISEKMAGLLQLPVIPTKPFNVKVANGDPLPCRENFENVNVMIQGKFSWDAEADASFNALKQAMTSTPTLVMPNFNEPFVIESDASGEGIGVVLTHQGRLVAFMSRPLGANKKSWPGRDNAAVDALSRVMNSPSLAALFVPETSLWDAIKNEAVGNLYMQKISKSASDTPDDGEIVIEAEAILDTIWIKKGSSFEEERLVKWKKLPAEDAAWENTKELKEKFLTLNLDKVPLKEGAYGDIGRNPFHEIDADCIKFFNHFNDVLSCYVSRYVNGVARLLAKSNRSMPDSVQGWVLSHPAFISDILVADVV
ncbi:hypothetical protein AgCh_008725 [Apium graveolens]